MTAADASTASSKGASGLPSVLADILQRKEREVQQLKADMERAGAEHPLHKRMAQAAAGNIRSSAAFSEAIRKPRGTVCVIAEIKRQSPSAGVLAEVPDVRFYSQMYYKAGAAAISVLTDEAFAGTLDDLRTVVEHQKNYRGNFPGPCPVLRKDFIIDEVQIAEAAEAGAAAVLLIVAALGREKLQQLLQATERHGLEALVEVHDEAELEVAKAVGAKIIGVNARNLHTFEVNLDVCMSLIKRFPDGAIAVAESGIKETTDAWRLRDAGFSALLIGELLMRASQSTKYGANAYESSYNQAFGIIRAFQSKGSVKFGPSTLARGYGMNEGAKESLGYLEM